jgi:hypothetical protein
MRDLEVISLRNEDNPRKREDRAELAKNVCHIVIERALDGNPMCIGIFQKARRLTQQK